MFHFFSYRERREKGRRKIMDRQSKAIRINHDMRIIVHKPKMTKDKLNTGNRIKLIRRQVGEDHNLPTLVHSKLL